MGVKKVDVNKIQTMTGLPKIEKFMGFLMEFQLRPCCGPHWRGHTKSLSQKNLCHWFLLPKKKKKKAEESMLILNQP